MYLPKNPAAEHVCTVPAARYASPVVDEEYIISVSRIKVRRHIFAPITKPTFRNGPLYLCVRRMTVVLARPVQDINKNTNEFIPTVDRKVQKEPKVSLMLMPHIRR